MKWDWAYYSEARKDEVSPWAEGFVNDYNWIKKTNNAKFISKTYF